MKEFYKDVNPWNYGDKHKKVYGILFNDIEDKLPDKMDIVELGSGEGYFAEEFINRFNNKINSYTCIDISSDALVRSSFKLSKLGFNGILRFILADFDSDDLLGHPELRLSLEDSNLIIAMESLYYAHHPTRVLNNINNLLKSETMMMISDSLVLYVIREFPHRKLNHELIKKVTIPLYHDGKIQRSLKTFLSKKKGN